jgi:hypothetical protein
MNVLSILERNFRYVAIPAGPQKKNPGHLARAFSFSQLPGDVGAAGHNSTKQAGDYYDQLLHRDHPQLQIPRKPRRGLPLVPPRYPPLSRA